MKRLIFLTVLMMSILICGTALAAEPKVGDKFTFVGKATEEVAHGENGERIPVYILVEEPSEKYIILDNIYNSTKNFASCFEESQYGGKLIEITAQVVSLDPSIELKIDKSSICKPR